MPRRHPEIARAGTWSSRKARRAALDALHESFDPPAWLTHVDLRYLQPKGDTNPTLVVETSKGSFPVKIFADQRNIHHHCRDHPEVSMVMVVVTAEDSNRAIRDKILSAVERLM